MNTPIAVGLIVMPLLIILVVGISFDRRIRKRSSDQGDKVRQYLNEEP